MMRRATHESTLTSGRAQRAALRRSGDPRTTSTTEGDSLMPSTEPTPETIAAADLTPGALIWDGGRIATVERVTVYAQSLGIELSTRAGMDRRNIYPAPDERFELAPMGAKR